MIHGNGDGISIGIDVGAGKTAMRMMIRYALNSDTAQLALDSTLRGTNVQHARAFLKHRRFRA